MFIVLQRDGANFYSFFLRGCEPLTGDDIAEVIVFAAGRRENVVIADTLIFPSHQVCGFPDFYSFLLFPFSLFFSSTTGIRD